MNTRSASRLVAGSVLAAAAGSASAQCTSAGVDAAIGDLTGVTAYGSSGGIAAFSVGATVCNRGDAPLPYGAAVGGRPMIGSGLYRLSTVGGATRIEQIGLGWVFNTASPLSTNLCCTVCGGGTSTTVGPHCSCPESASFMGTTSVLTPRFGVNATTGTISNPSPLPPAQANIGRRLQAAIADIDPALNPGAVYFAEEQIVTSDDPGANRGNNSSFRRCAFTGAGQDWSISLQGTTQALRPAIYAWQDADPTVVVQSVVDPTGGQILVAGRATALANGRWRYEYAVQNITSDRSVSAMYFAAPPDVNITNTGFHDVAYHSGDGAGGVTVSGADWQFDRFCDVAAWRTETYAVNPNANAIRWGTLYNFRFDGDGAPTDQSSGSLFFFKPGTVGVAPVSGLAGPRHRFDVDGDGQRTPADVAAFVNLWFSELSSGSGLLSDFDHNGIIEPADIAGFVALWLNPPGC